MNQIMRVVCDKDGFPLIKMHGLRMLNPAIFSKLPLESADSTNIARNIGIDQAWKGNYMPPTKEMRAAVMRSRIESVNSANFYQARSVEAVVHIRECRMNEILQQRIESVQAGKNITHAQIEAKRSREQLSVVLRLS